MTDIRNLFHCLSAVRWVSISTSGEVMYWFSVIPYAFAVPFELNMFLTHGIGIALKMRIPCKVHFTYHSWPNGMIPQFSPVWPYCSLLSYWPNYLYYLLTSVILFKAILSAWNVKLLFIILLRRWNQQRKRIQMFQLN